MTKKRDMKWALELALQALDDIVKYYCPVWNVDTYRQAADMLKNGGPVVEKEHVWCRCNWCSRWFVDGYDYANHSCGRTTTMGNQKVTTIKKWTEREKIQIVTEKSESTFEENNEQM